jgi:hypothetical protein
MIRLKDFRDDDLWACSRPASESSAISDLNCHPG